MAADKKFDEQVNITVNITVGNVYLQNNASSSSNNLLKAGETNKKSSFLDVLARIGGFINRLATKLIAFIRKVLLSLI